MHKYKVDYQLTYQMQDSGKVKRTREIRNVECSQSKIAAKTREEIISILTASHKRFSRDQVSIQLNGIVGVSSSVKDEKWVNDSQQEVASAETKESSDSEEESTDSGSSRRSGRRTVRG